LNNDIDRNLVSQKILSVFVASLESWYLKWRCFKKQTVGILSGLESCMCEDIYYCERFVMQLDWYKYKNLITEVEKWYIYHKT